MATKTIETFDIGNIYKDERGKLFLAVDEDKALSFSAHGKPIIRTPKAQLASVRGGASVNVLCDAWGVSTETIDHWAEKYRAPLPEPKSRNSRKKLDKHAEEHFWSKHRTASILS